MKNVIKAAAGLATLAPAVLGFSANADAASGKVTASALNVRTAPSTSGKVIGKVYRNSAVNYTDYNSSWVKINFKGKTAYVSKKYVQAASAPSQPSTGNESYQGKVTASALNVRAGIGTSAQIVGKLPNGTVVNVSNSSNGWLYVTSGNVKGWVSGQYVTKVMAASTNPAPTTPAARPVATDYKTMDLRYPSRVTADEINNYIEKYEALTGKHSVFHGQGQLFINVGTDAGINQLILAAMAIHESAYGTNELAIKKYNLFSVGAYDADPFYYAYTFQSVEQSVKYQAKFLKERYLNPSNWRYKGAYLGDANSGINYYYATDKQWGEKIAAHANRIHPFSAAEYTNVSLMSGAIPAVADPIKPPAKK
ncbi:SH3 domain-containing protein [Ectobacillus panaciterrae]|uniref:SH3 domain-containing protein n=1 Tax=Ectobacillus panaciterrae TaxID=363872 RepID=UPI0004240926|nr:SH3 domain-containing protein [Ectobacillus panaciterrae]